MILVDTSVLIDFLRNRNSPAVDKFEQALKDGMPFGLTPYTCQEVLQGAATEKDYARLKQYLDTQVFYNLRRGRESHAAAARIYFDCRRAGLTVSGAIDCLIAQTAIENDLFLLHSDGDYVQIKKVSKELSPVVFAIGLHD